MFKKLILIMLLFSSTAAYAAPEDKYASETRAAVAMAYNMAVFSLDPYTLDTGLEPVICWPFPVDFEEFYVPVQLRVNDIIDTYFEKNEQNKLHNIIGWLTWSAIQYEHGCL